MRHYLFAALALTTIACAGPDPTLEVAQPKAAVEPVVPAAVVGTTVTLNVPAILTTGEEAKHFKYFIGWDELQPNVAFPVSPSAVKPDGTTLIRIEYSIDAILDPSVDHIGRRFAYSDLALEYPFKLAAGENPIEIAAMSTQNEISVSDDGDVELSFYRPIKHREIKENTYDGDLSLQIGTGPQISWDEYTGFPDGEWFDVKLLPTFVGHVRWAWANSELDYDIDKDHLNVLLGDGGRASKGSVTFVSDPNPAKFTLAKVQWWNVVCNGHEDDPDWGAAKTWGVEPGKTISVTQLGSLTCKAGADAARIGVTIDPGRPVYVQLARVDVDEVVLPGHARAVAGTYTITNSDGVAIITDAPTRTGIDLPPGHYTITTTAPGLAVPVVRNVDL